MRTVTSFLGIVVLTALAGAQSPAPLAVRILDHRDAKDRAQLTGEGLPITFRGLRPGSLSELQKWLRLAANTSYPRGQDRDQEPIEPPSLHNPEGVFPSAATLIIRCAPGQDVGWVQAVVQACGILPWDSREGQFRDSPLIQDIRVTLLDDNARSPVAIRSSWLRREDGAARPMKEIWLGGVPTGWTLPAAERPVAVRLGAYGPAVGVSRGYRLHATNPDAAIFSYEPDTARDRLRERLGRFRKASPGGQIRIVADARVPFIYVHDYLQIIQGNELAVVLDTTVTDELVADMTASITGGGPAPFTHPLRKTSDPVIGEESDPQAMGEDFSSADVKAAIGRSLAWLASTQSQDGSWNAKRFGGEPAHDVGVTALAVLAFLGDGHTDQGGAYQEHVRQALAYLRHTQDAEGCIGPRADPRFTYNHAIAALALCEAYGMTRSALLKAPAQQALNFCMFAQNPYKAWRYGVRPGDNDTSITSWMVMALRSGQLAGLEVSRPSLEWALQFIEEMTDPETGRTGYTQRGERPVRDRVRVDQFPADQSEAMTAAGMMVRILCGQEPQGAMLRKGADLLGAKPPVWSSATTDMIYWYFGSLVLFQRGGSSWLRWQDALLRALLPHQESAPSDASGSIPPSGAWGHAGGRVFSTALMTMALEIASR